jgi:hypothetical protein
LIEFLKINENHEIFVEKVDFYSSISLSRSDPVWQYEFRSTWIHLIALPHDPLFSIFWLQLNCLSQMGKFKFHPPLCMNFGRNLEQINISHFILFSGAIISRIFTFIYELGK